MKYERGFTVLEFLVVITMIGIIIAIAFASLSLSRSRSRDDQRVAKVQQVSVALEEFYKECKEYPLTLTASYPCGQTGKTLGSFIGDIDNTVFNQSTSEYHYIPLSFSGQTIGAGCTGYHLGVQLENQNNSFASRDSEVDSTSQSQSVVFCTSSALTTQTLLTLNGFNGTAPGMYDIRR